jgi:hypothetical protein
VSWVVHNLGLAVCFGGSVFGKIALNPNLNVIGCEADRGKFLNTTWNRFNAISAGSFIASAATWLPGRLGLSGGEIDDETRNMVPAKVILFAAGTLSGLASVIQGRALTNEAPGGAEPIASGTTPASDTPERTAGLLRSVNQRGNANLAITEAILSIITILSMKATESSKFSAVSRLLP